MGKLDGKVAVVTASTRSIGRAVAETYVREGANVVISGRSAEKGQAALEEMDAGDAVHFIACDATQQEQVEGLIDGTVERYGQLDIAVLNAGGIQSASPIAEMTDENWQYALDVNLNHTFWGIRRALQHMLPRKYGRIIAMSSVEGKMSKPTIAHYSSNKHAINGLVKCAAHESGAEGITVNAILPGIVLTDMFYETGPATIEAMQLEGGLDALAAVYASGSAIQRPNTVEEVAAVALLLARDEAHNISGCLFPVDGGTMPY